MNTEELHKQYTQLLRGAPDVLTKWPRLKKDCLARQS